MKKHIKLINLLLLVFTVLIISTTFNLAAWGILTGMLGIPYSVISFYNPKYIEDLRNVYENWIPEVAHIWLFTIILLSFLLSLYYFFFKYEVHVDLIIKKRAL